MQTLEPKHDLDTLRREILDAARTVHAEHGAQLLETAYENFLCDELSRRGIAFERNMWMPDHCSSWRLNTGQQLDLLVDGRLAVDVRATDRVTPLDSRRMQHCLQLAHAPEGIILNFRDTAPHRHALVVHNRAFLRVAG